MKFYYHCNPKENLQLSPEESAHAIKVLRAKVGDPIEIVDGLGSKFLAEITNANHRKCSFKIISEEKSERKIFKTHIVIAPTKSTDRLEWFVEKACELGADEITVMITKRTERKKVNLERLEKKAISAMKQSKSYWKCKINALTTILTWMGQDHGSANKFVAFVETGKEALLQHKIVVGEDTTILIGPEGDFTHQEITLAIEKGFVPVSLGANVLRTETAGVIAVHTVNLMNG